MDGPGAEGMDGKWGSKYIDMGMAECGLASLKMRVSIAGVALVE
jgi:hypothetical protein